MCDLSLSAFCVGAKMAINRQFLKTIDGVIVAVRRRYRNPPLDFTLAAHYKHEARQ
jgi:hypothetical protein